MCTSCHVEESILQLLKEHGEENVRSRIYTVDHDYPSHVSQYHKLDSSGKLC